MTGGTAREGLVGPLYYTGGMMDSIVRPPGAVLRSARIELRMTEAGRQSIIDLAAQEERSFSDMVRVLLSRGLQFTNQTAKPVVSNRAIHPAPKPGKK